MTVNTGADTLDIEVDRVLLGSALDLIVPIARMGGPGPQRGAVLLEAAGDTTALQATNLTSYVRCVMPSAVRAAGSAAVDAKRLHELVSALDAERITISADTAEVVRVLGGRTRARLRALPTEHLPTFPRPAANAVYITLRRATVDRLVQQVAFACSDDATRPQLCGLYLGQDDDGLIAAATNGHRLARLVLEEKISDVPSCIVPADGLRQAAKLFDGEDTTVTLTIDKTSMHLSTPRGVAFSVGLVEADFPALGQVIPKSTKCNVTIEGEPLLWALRRVCVVHTTREGGVTLDLAPGCLTLSARSPEHGEIAEDLTVEYAGEPLRVGINARYLREPLMALGAASRIVLGFNDGDSPVTLRPVDDAGYVYVVMPMRL